MDGLEQGERPTDPQQQPAPSLPPAGMDPTYCASNQFQAQFRLPLLNRSNQLGPPPYANCP